MIEKIVLYLTIISFAIFIISLKNIEEYMKEKYKKTYKNYFKEYFGFRSGTTLFFLLLFQLFSSKLTNLAEKDEKVKRFLSICRSSLIIFLILIVTYFSIKKWQETSTQKGLC